MDDLKSDAFLPTLPEGVMWTWERRSNIMTFLGSQGENLFFFYFGIGIIQGVYQHPHRGVHTNFIAVFRHDDPLGWVRNLSNLLLFYDQSSKVFLSLSDRYGSKIMPHQLVKL